MKRWCVVCSLRQASVYCKNDDAYLCNSCDETIHSSNCFAARHERVRVCELCVDALATIRCTNEDALLCDACDLSVHSNPAAMNHERSAISNDADTAVCPDGRQTVAATPSGESTSNPSASALVDVSKGEGATSCSCSHEISQDSSVDLAVPGAGVPPVAQVIPSWDDLCQLDWSKPGGSSKFYFFKDDDVPEIEPAWADRLDMGFDFDELLVDLDGDSEDSAMPAAVEVAKEEDNVQKKEETPPTAPDEAPLPLPASSPATPTQEQAVAAGPSPLPAAAPTVPALVAPLTALPTAMTPFLGTAFASTMAATPLPGLIDPAALMTCPQAFALPYPGALSMLQPSGIPAPAVASPASTVMDRAARVARYREKRKHRKFQKTIRYQSRKAYAEIRPRIKGRFATKSEVAAMKAAGTLPLPLPEDDVQVVPDAAS